MSRYPFLGLGFYSWSQKFGAAAAAGDSSVSSIATNKIFVGAPHDDDDGNSSGAVYVYDLDGNNEVKITASDAAAYDRFGTSVAIGTNKFVVGAYGGSGAVYVYDSDGTNEVKITASDGASGDRFGEVVAVGSNKIVVGAQRHGIYAGAVYVYDLDGTNEVKITSPDAGDYYFGSSVGIGTNKIVVGATYDDNSADDAGAVYVYDLDGTQVGIITASDAASRDAFGSSVGIGTNKIVVGAKDDDDDGNSSGAVYVYDLDGTNEVKITASDGASSDKFGSVTSVGIGTNKIAVGVKEDDDDGSSSGAVYVYDLDGTNEVKITASDAAAVDYFGSSVAIGTNKIVVGATNDDDGASDAGAVYVYDLDGTNEVKITASDAAAYDKFGTSVAVRVG